MKHLCHGGGDQHIVVRIATRCALDSPGFEPRWGQDIFSSPYPSKPALGPTRPVVLLVQELFSWGKAATYWRLFPFYAAPRLRMSGAMLYIPPWRGRWQLYRSTFPDYVIVWSYIPHRCVSFHQHHYLWYHSPKHHIHYFWINGNGRELTGQSNCDGRDGTSGKYLWLEVFR
jgi:hypothetical protein